MIRGQTARAFPGRRPRQRWRAPWRRGCAWARWGWVPGGPTVLVSFVDAVRLEPHRRSQRNPEDHLPKLPLEHWIAGAKDRRGEAAQVGRPREGRQERKLRLLAGRAASESLVVEDPRPRRAEHGEGVAVRRLAQLPGAVPIE